MKSKLLVAAGTAIAVGMLTIALPVFAQTQDTEVSHFGPFSEIMHERMQNGTPLTFGEDQDRMTENLTEGQTRAQQQLDDLYSGDLEARLKDRLTSVSSYLEKAQAATSEEELTAIRDEMHAQMEALRESGDLPFGPGQSMMGKMGRGMYRFADSDDAQTDS